MNRFALYRFLLRNSIWNKDEKCRKACKFVLSNPGAMAAVFEDVCDMHVLSGPLTDFLDWLIANADAIIAIITKIVDLFSEDQK